MIIRIIRGPGGEGENSVQGPGKVQGRMSSSSRKIHPDDGDLGTARRIPDAKLGITSLDQASSELVEKGIIDQRRKSRAASTFIDEEKAALQGVNPASRAEREQLISALESGHTFLAFGVSSHHGWRDKHAVSFRHAQLSSLFEKV